LSNPLGREIGERGFVGLLKGGEFLGRRGAHGRAEFGELLAHAASLGEPAPACHGSTARPCSLAGRFRRQGGLSGSTLSE
jgi:hypothetical protein